VGGRLWFVANGDIADVHPKGQIISRVPEHILYLGVESFRPLLALKPEKVWLVEGTPSHTGGEAADMEQALAHRLHAEGLRIISNGHQWTWPELDLSIYQNRCHLAHHGKAGAREHTLQSNAAGHAADIANAYRARGHEPDHLWITSHRHILADSGQSLVNKTRYTVTPAMQLKTPFANMVASHRPRFLSDLGGLAVVFYPDERPYQLLAFVKRPARAAPTEVVA